MNPALPLCPGAPGRVDDLVAVAQVPLELLLGHEQPLAPVLDEDAAVGLEEALRGLLRGELGLGRAGGLGGARTLVG